MNAVVQYRASIDEKGPQSVYPFTVSAESPAKLFAGLARSYISYLFGSTVFEANRYIAWYRWRHPCCALDCDRYFRVRSAGKARICLPVHICNCPDADANMVDRYHKLCANRPPHGINGLDLDRIECRDRPLVVVQTITCAAFVSGAEIGPVGAPSLKLLARTSSRLGGKLCLAGTRFSAMRRCQRVGN